MIKCHLCNAEFKTNAGGDLTKHLKNKHGVSLEDYVIHTKYNGNPPKCACGMCDDRPLFHRGKFKKYAKGHSSVRHQHKYLKDNNKLPTCINCGKPLKLNDNRKRLNKFCSFKCSGAYNKDIIIEKMRPKIIELQSDPLHRKRISNSMKSKFMDDEYYNNWYKRHTDGCSSDIAKKNYSNAAKKLWNNAEYRDKVTKSLAIACNTPEEIVRRSDYMKKAWQDPVKQIPLYKNLFNIRKRLSKLHQKTKDYLELRKLGFKSEQPIWKYCVDELHHDKKIIIEVNGDYIHANPLLYTADDIIRLPGSTYTAQEKWDADKKRTDWLESQGYTVYVIWESDDLDNAKLILDAILNRTNE
jgi:very-short-patch-repair endonuclease